MGDNQGQILVVVDEEEDREVEDPEQQEKVTALSSLTAPPGSEHSAMTHRRLISFSTMCVHLRRQFFSFHLALSLLLTHTLSLQKTFCEYKCNQAICKEFGFKDHPDTSECMRDAGHNPAFPPCRLRLLRHIAGR